MWTEQHRKIYQRGERRYPSDMTDGEWVRLKPLIPPAKPGGRPRETNMREAINAILYLLRTGCPWRYLPREGFSPRSTVYNIFRNFQKAGVWEAIWNKIPDSPARSTRHRGRLSHVDLSENDFEIDERPNAHHPPLGLACSRVGSEPISCPEPSADAISLRPDHGERQKPALRAAAGRRGAGYRADTGGRVPRHGP
jgi:transposase